jgi:hypothetical protein
MNIRRKKTVGKPIRMPDTVFIVRALPNARAQKP